MHHGVVSLITDPKKHIFLFEQKDGCYKHYGNCYAPFGGEIEPEETAPAALEREILEEMGRKAWRWMKGSTRFYKRYVLPSNGSLFMLEVYETVLSKRRMMRIKRKINREDHEDYRIKAAVFRREILPGLIYAHSLEKVVTDYLDNR